ncbi:Na+/H+ antiporter NhaC [Fusibacter sp. Q10-2]|uniref:Na+/H+ antiporter NhaC n=2 Tax=Fusibacter ferrireducens TaxID=2785058 RepID=A0ABR9ZTW8_9FIRM|nr:Na+/H+ antiporter NhaC [Fusibacter ferrireducens]
MEKVKKEKKEATLLIAMIPVLFLAVSLILTLVVYKLGEPHIPLITSAMVAAAVAMYFLNYSWEEIEEGIVETIKMSMGAIIIILIIGILVGIWIKAGIIPTMVYYGLQVLSPQYFLVAAFIICAVVSVATGSSWSTVATVGIALMSIGTALGISVPIIGGAIISGSYLGDKISPLSDTTNLAPAMAGANLFDHIRHMLYTTLPSAVISIILFWIIGMRYAGGELDTVAINNLLDTMKDMFYISPILLLVPCMVIGMVIFRIPAIPGLFFASVVGLFFAVIFQGAGLKDLIDIANNGFTSFTGDPAIDELLTGGGMQSMMWTTSLTLCAMIFGGVMEKTGMLNVIACRILERAKTDGQLILATLISCYGIVFIAGDQYLSIVIPGRMYKDAYAQRRLHPKNLSRALEDAGTLASPLVPWSSCGAYMMITLGLAPWAYVPYCFLNYINPIISAIYGFTGFSIEKLPEDTNAFESSDSVGELVG